jgi:hypothetical protein
MLYCDKHRRQHLDAGCSKCWEDEAKAKPAATVEALANTQPSVPKLANSVLKTGSGLANAPTEVGSGLANAADGPHRLYRDKDKRRAYMRTYMAERRAGARPAPR